MWADSNCRETIDYIFDAFVSRLPPSCQASARSLPIQLGLSTDPEARWGEVFDDISYLGLPMLILLEGDRYASEDLCIAALRAHLFAMLASLIHDRFDRHELEPNAELCAVLLVLERERDLIVASLCEMGDRQRLDCHVAEREARRAISTEQAMFSGQVPARMDDYVALCVGRHSPAFPAALAGAAAAGYTINELGHMHELVLGVMLGIATRDEIRDWFERAQIGRSWTATLTAQGRSRDEVFLDMLALAASSFNKAVAAAHALGATELADWALRQAQIIEMLVERREVESASTLAKTLGLEIKRACAA